VWGPSVTRHHGRRLRIGPSGPRRGLLGASLDAAARAIKATGDDRSIDQIRADLFVERLTGQVTAEAVPVAIGLIIDGESLTGQSERAAATEDGTTGAASASVSRGHP
jgi:hypothetical protein